MVIFMIQKPDQPSHSLRRAVHHLGDMERWDEADELAKAADSGMGAPIRPQSVPTWMTDLASAAPGASSQVAAEHRSRVRVPQLPPRSTEPLIDARPRPLFLRDCAQSSPSVTEQIRALAFSPSQYASASSNTQTPTTAIPLSLLRSQRLQLARRHQRDPNASHNF